MELTYHIIADEETARKLRQDYPKLKVFVFDDDNSKLVDEARLEDIFNKINNHGKRKITSSQ